MAMKLNPELKVGDEVILMGMSEEMKMRPGLKGVVQALSNTPWGIQYSVKWENGSTLDLIPDVDKWILKSDWKKPNKVNEELEPRMENIIKNKDVLKFIKEKEKVFNFLRLLQKSGLTNMMGAHGFLTYTSDNLTDYIKGQFKDPDEYEELIEAADESRNAIIRGLMNMYDANNMEVEDMDKVNRDFDKLVRKVMQLYLFNYQDFVKNS